MASDFDSFDSSILGSFIESPLEARGDGVVLFQGDLFVVHQGTTFDGVTTNGFAAYDTSTSLWSAVPTTTNFTPTSSEFITVGDRFFALTSSKNIFLWGTSSSVTKFQSPSTTIWRDDLGYSSNWPTINPAGTVDIQMMDLQGDLLLMNIAPLNLVQNVSLSGSPTTTNNIVKYNPLEGYFESFGAIPENILVKDVIAHNQYIVISPFRGMIAVTLSATGYTNAISSDLQKTVTFKETGNEQEDTGTILSVDATPSNNTFTVTIDGQTESVAGITSNSVTASALVDACNASTQSAFLNIVFNVAGANIIATGRYPDYTFSASLTVAGGGTGSVTNFSSAFTSKTFNYASGALKRYNNTTRTWYVQVNTIDKLFFNNYADVAITSGTGSGTYEDVTPTIDNTGYYYTTDGTTWNPSSIQYQNDDGLDASAGSSGGRLLIGGASSGGDAPILIDGTTESGLFEWNIAADTYTPIDCDKFSSFANLPAIGSSVYCKQLTQGIPSDGIYKITGATLTLVSPDNGSDAAGMNTIETRGNDLLIGTNSSSAGITKPPNNFFKLSGGEYSEYLGTSGTSSSSNAVNKIINPEKDAVLTTSGTWVGLSIISGTPFTGAEAGGVSIAIVGSGFTESTTVTFGGNSATNVVFNSVTSITCDSPAGTGVVSIVVTDGLDSATLFPGHSYLAPISIVSLDVTSGTTAGGTGVIITGTGFVEDETTVTFDGITADSIFVESSTEVYCETPAHAAGAVDVTVSDGVDSDTLTNGYTYV